MARMRRETGTPKIFDSGKFLVLVLTKRHVGSGNEIDSFRNKAIYPERMRK